jgi:hypothetical protein
VDVAADGERTRAEVAGRLRRIAAGVDLDRREIGAETRLHLRLHAARKRCTRTVGNRATAGRARGLSHHARGLLALRMRPNRRATLGSERRQRRRAVLAFARYSTPSMYFCLWACIAANPFGASPFGCDGRSPWKSAIFRASEDDSGFFRSTFASLTSALGRG